MQNHTQVGATVRRVMAAGELVGDDLVESVVEDGSRRRRLGLRLHHRRVPQGRRQAEFFLESYDVDGVIVLDLPAGRSAAGS